MTATTSTQTPEAPATAALRTPVWNMLADRADALRRSLPPRPEGAAGRYEWLRSLSPAQARRADLLARLDALCGHVAGRPALGLPSSDPLPEEALQEAEGFDADLTELIERYRSAKGS
ncbi:hypothetical protein [Streptomyces sp. NPDC093707]|uniref:hypothetical protein n=1 Tax=Streptomyces sp. NPDC093707 TaxID=3154984 RepID=UPI00344DD8ED